MNLPGYGVVDDANSTLNESFSCYEKRYGYYADIAKDCSVFHLCYPIREPTTQEIIYQRFSFVCSDNFVFDQRQLVCVDNETTPVSCEDSVDYYIPSNDRLIESLQQTQPDMFAEEEDTNVNNSSSTEASAASDADTATDSAAGTAEGSSDGAVGSSGSPVVSNVHNEYR